MEKHIGGGLRSLPKDDKDFQFGAVFGKAQELPESLFLTTPTGIKDQYQSDLCAAFSTCSANEFHEEVKMSPEYAFAKAKMGEWQTWGLNLRDACKVWINFGGLEIRFATLTLEKDGRDVVADWENWDKGLDFAAGGHRQKSYFRVDSGNDIFDDICNALYLRKDQKSPVVTGAIWRGSWTAAEKGEIEDKDYAGEQGFGHAFLIVGFDSINGGRLIAQLSNGTDIGDSGYFYFPKRVVDENFIFGSFQFNDLPKEDAKFLATNKLNVNSIWARIFLAIKHLF